MTDEQQWDHSVDVLVAGSGNGGLTAALCCHEMGVTDVLVIEKSNLFGGTSSVSGGGVWVPCNRYAVAAGAEDSLAKAKTYLFNCLPPGQVPEAMLDTYLREAPRMIDFLHQRTRVCYVTLEHYLDYYTDLEGSMPGHRSMEPEPINADVTVRSCRYFGPEVAAARRSVRPVPDRACGSASVRANRVAMRFQCPTPFLTLAITPLRSASIAIWQALRTAPYRHDRTVTRGYPGQRVPAAAPLPPDDASGWKDLHYPSGSGPVDGATAGLIRYGREDGGKVPFRYPLAFVRRPL